MTSTVIETLCGRQWRWDPRYNSTIEFETNGAGRLVSFQELSIFIAAEIEWSAIDAGSLSQPLGNEPASFTLQITLTKRMLGTLGGMELNDGYKINEHVLHDAAFEPKILSLTLEKGDFPITMLRVDEGYVYWHTYRLSFDKSPFPPLKEWSKWRPCRNNAYDKRVDFYDEQTKVTDGDETIHVSH